MAEINCKYKVPITFPDTVIVAARVLPESLDEFGFLMHQVVFSHKFQRIAAEGNARMVCYDYINLKKAPIPEELRRRILSSE